MENYSWEGRRPPGGKKMMAVQHLLPLCLMQNGFLMANGAAGENI